MNDILLFSGAAIVAVLAAVAAYLHFRLFRLNRYRQQLAAEADKQRTDQQEDIVRSIRLIARALDSRQVGATEASIRISVLLDALQVAPEVKTEFQAFYQLAEKASHIPRLEGWQALSKAERAGFQKELTQLEAQHGPAVSAAAQRIQTRELV